MSYFISFEGGEGTGKSTQIKILKGKIDSSNYKCLVIQEPGTTQLGNKLRNLLKKETPKEESITYMSELLLFSAARSELVTKIIKPNLKKNNLIIIADRYVDSTTAYQGFGRNLDLSEIKLINNIATQMIYPDITFLLDSSPKIMSHRIMTKDNQSKHVTPENVRKDVKGSRKFEEEPLDFHNRVRNGYLEILKSYPGRIIKIDANQDKNIISNLIWQNLQNKIPNLK
ncbi:MAG: dTMP kinase [SAR202 cluster bacterium]|nr:dTMP kinase [SAR202 cluster bacterium]